MSASDHPSAHEGSLSHVHSHDLGHGDAAPHGSFKGYITGFLLSAVLTFLPFWLVMGDVFKDRNAGTVIIIGLALIQVLVHMVYFLHMNTRSEGGWNMLALIFTVVLVVITFAGSLWVMYHMNANMMPMSAQQMRSMP